MHFTRLEERYRNLQRLRQIANILIKHGLGQMVQDLPLVNLLTLGKRLFLFRRSSSEAEAGISTPTLPERVRLVCEELGPTFVKMGQLLSTRPDLVPIEFTEEFKKLQDNVPPVPFELISPILEAEFRAPIDKIFLKFDRTPVAAASIAQVYNAILAPDRRVIVKVQRPNIGPVIDQDIRILFYLAKMLEKYMPDIRMYNPVGIVEEFSRSIHRELDFMLEASNAQHMRELFASDPTIYIPQICWELTNHRAMVMERVEGVSVDELGVLKSQGQDLKQLAVNGCHAFLKQVFEFGFFHADPHPGNILVMADGRVVFLDFGIMGRLDEFYMTHIANIFFSLAERNYEKMIAEYTRIGLVTPETNVRHFKEDLIDFIEPYYGQPIKRVPVSEVFNHTNRIMLSHKIKVPAELILLGKMLVFVESIGRNLDPEFDLLAISKPYAQALMEKRYSPRFIYDMVSRDLAELGEMAKNFPRQWNMLMRKLLRNELEVVVNHPGAEEGRSQQRESHNRLAMSLVVAALVIGSSLIIHAGRPPHLMNTPALGLIGFAIAVMLGIWLIISMFISWRR